MCGVVQQVAEAMWDYLVSDFMPVPTQANWRAILEDSKELWNFLNCVGAVDGKHFVIKPPAYSGSLFHN